MANKNKMIGGLLIALICIIAVIGGLLLTKASGKDQEKDEIAEVSGIVETTDSEEAPKSMMETELTDAPESAKKIVDSVLDDHADEIEAAGLSMDDAKAATIKATEPGNYVVVLGERYIFINSTDDLFSIGYTDDFGGSGEEVAKAENLYGAVYNALWYNPDVLDEANVTMDDLWEYVLQRDHLQETQDAGVYTVEYQGTLITIDITKGTAEASTEAATKTTETDEGMTGKEIALSEMTEAGEEAHEQIDTYIEENEDLLSWHGISVDDAETSTVYLRNGMDDNYYVVVGEKYINTNGDGSYFEVGNFSNWLGDGDFEADKEIRNKCLTVLGKNQDILQGLGITLEDIRTYLARSNRDGVQVKHDDGTYEIVYDIRSTDEDGVYEIDYNGSTLVININDSTVTIK